MLASGDPIGDVEAWPGAIDAFLDEATRHAWVPAVIGLRRDRRRGLDPGGRPVAPWSSATRRSSRSPTSPWRAGRCATSARWSTGSSGPATPAGSGGSRDLADAEQERIRQRRRRLARHARPSAASPWRSAASATPPTATAWSSPRTRSATRATARAGGLRGDLRAVLHFVPWGARRHVAGPDAPRPRRRPGAQRAADRRRPCRRRPELGVPAVSLNFAMFRSALATRRAARRRAGAAGLARSCCCSCPAGSRSSRCTGSTPSSGPLLGAAVPGLPRPRDLPRIGVRRDAGRGVHHAGQVARQVRPIAPVNYLL